MRIACRLGPGDTIVTLLCDSRQRYQSTLFNPEFLRAKGSRCRAGRREPPPRCSLGRSVEFLRSLGHDVVRVDDLLPKTSSASTIVAKAVHENRILVTQYLTPVLRPIPSSTMRFVGSRRGVRGAGK